ncbi:MAG: cytochrome c3 family protein [Betaproteobacteria bacterium]|nr:cytochrome c3 family protein [Betaproteobacteria bacterium]
MAKPDGRRIFWIGWVIMTIGIGGYLAAGLFMKSAASNPLLSPARSMFLPGKTSHGHYQIELACESCHESPFGGREALQEACERCHGQELKNAVDKHPRSKFTDPRNADLLEKLDALLCVTCHVEHRPEITGTLGVTLAGDFCFHCHQDIAKDRPSHEGMAFNTCNAAGCHKFHDNRALYEDFLAKHLDEPALLARRRLPARNFREVAAAFPGYPADRFPLKAQTAPDAPAELMTSKETVGDWLATAHARSGVNCSGCHQVENEGAKAWVRRPDHKACAACHGPEAKGFLAGKHGMRLAEGLPPMTPGRARRPMHAKARDAQLSCTSCHSAHRFDTKKAAVEACTGCHRDGHTAAYERSPHHALWKKELAGELPPGSGVSCASCHLPRDEYRAPDLDAKRVLVQHNQSDNLRPSEKMIRPVCMSCHGLGFSTDALADAKLVQDNFLGQPRARVKSLEMVARRAKVVEAKRQARKP